MIRCPLAPAALFLSALFWLGLGLSAKAQTPAPAPTSGQTYAVLIGGIPGELPYSRWYTDWLTRFQKVLMDASHVPADHIATLSDKDATWDAITAAFKKFAQEAKPQDQLIVFIVGHGENKGPAPKLTLAGPDADPDQLAALLNSFPGKNQIVLNFSASSGDFLKALSASGRVNIAATSPTEADEPVLAEFFLRGLESKRADADKNGTITLLETFNWAAQQDPLWMARWLRTSTGKPGENAPTIWKASGKETVEIFEKLYAGVPSRQLDTTSDRAAADAVVPLAPPDGQVTDEWLNRRAVNEHAMLEDCGQGTGVAEIGEKGLDPIVGQNPGDPGYLAAHTVLGQPAPPQP